MRISRFFFALGLLVLPVFAGYSQDAPWTLIRCITYAYDNNIVLKQQALSVEVAKNNLNQSKLGILPSLNTGLSQSNRFGRSVETSRILRRPKMIWR